MQGVVGAGLLLDRALRNSTAPSESMPSSCSGASRGGRSLSATWPRTSVAVSNTVALTKARRSSGVMLLSLLRSSLSMNILASPVPDEGEMLSKNAGTSS